MSTTISVVTACLNARETIETCVASVREQRVPTEHIIVDGGSTDGTLEWVREAATSSPPSHRIVIHTGPDAGLYDAMNRGIEAATGDVVGFLNADDRYAGPGVLDRVETAFTDPEVSACYGDLVYSPSIRANQDLSDTTVMRFWNARSYRRSRFLFGWMPPHPTFYVRRSAYAEHGGFRLDCGSAADYESMLRLLYKHRLKALHIPAVLVIMRTGGVSNRSVSNRARAHRMDYRAWRINSIWPLPFTILMKPLRKVPQWLWHAGLREP